MLTSKTRVCNLCEATCGLELELSGQDIKSIKADPDDVFSKGAYCPKSQGLKDLYQDPDRLRKPLKKTAQGFQEIPWEQALDEVAERIVKLQSQHGKASIATYTGNPNVHNLGAMLALPMLLRALKSPHRYSATSVDQLPHMLIAHLMFGHSLMLPIADVDRANYMLIIGANPVVSNGSLLTAAGLSSKLKQIQKRGGKVTVIDPRYTETASQATEHHFIKPGKDIYLLAAIVKGLLTSTTHKQAPHIKGLDILMDAFGDYEDPHFEARTGMSPEIVDRIIHDLHFYEGAICYGRMGVSTQEHGSLCQWLINVINFLTGNLDSAGGVMFTDPAIDILNYISRGAHHKKFARRKTRVRGLPSFEGEFPVAALAEEILTSGEGQIKGLISIAGNPALSTPNGEQMRSALDKLDLFVAIDYYITESSAHADYILPPCSPLERSHYDLVFNALAIRNTARFSEATFKKQGKEDFDIILELWKRLDHGSKFQNFKIGAIAQGMIWLGPERILDGMLRRGPHKLTLKRLRENPHGIDLGALTPQLPDKLRTPDKKLDLAPEVLIKQFSQVKAQLQKEPNPTADGFQLIGRRNLRSNNSWMHNCQSLHLKKRDFHVLVNEDDGAALGLSNGQTVRVSGAVGSIEAPVRLTDKIMKGVVSMPHGWGHQEGRSKLKQAIAMGGANINQILSDQEVEPVSGNAILNGQRVHVSALELSQP
ncbi:molybdopterin-dependent oxidoreductase [Pseudobacteriovorax antillogorgiicola]|uniref:Anaerobic selenocysteine-containing dehydrogenase n=1 Tax=Pseudobacteriovorax antillogorgiicola TaxID=1513793 RepID=A0A1Y6BT30_9BACT|nr:molybdopterin-dependent oxidoreductase [Pseudobacteriovorax antillogorgiicola]TCS54662.1 anaerobic selenocysteine-containing dehydrogenase [Pseudobacteriovorax antillogorgiicola]SMF16789.1 Anaerobic selenocysteine-containing dehydrogenase [Pseudobacteriovorax antillogorgiicola]